MFIDVSLAVLILCFVIMGLFQGMILQVFRLGGLAAIYFFARFGAEPAGQWLTTRFSINPLAAYYVALIAGSALSYMVCSIAGLIVHRIVTGAGETPAKINRTLGGGMGLLRGAAVAFIIAAVIDMIPEATYSRWPAAEHQIRQSHAVALVHPVNPLLQLQFLTDAPTALRVARDPAARDRLERQPAFQRLRNNPKVQRALNDPEVQGLISQGDWSGLLRHPRIRGLFFDPEIREIINSPEFHKALNDASLGVPSGGPRDLLRESVRPHSGPRR